MELGFCRVLCLVLGETERKKGGGELRQDGEKLTYGSKRGGGWVVENRGRNGRVVEGEGWKWKGRLLDS